MPRSSLNEGLLSEEKQCPIGLPFVLLMSQASTKGFSRKRSNPSPGPETSRRSSCLNEGLLSEEKQSAEPDASKEAIKASTKGFSRKRSNRKCWVARCPRMLPQRRASLGREAITRPRTRAGVQRASTKGFSRKRSNACLGAAARRRARRLNEGLLSEEKQS